MALWLCRLYIDVDPDSHEQMLGYQHNGFSVDAGVCIQAHDRAGLERLLRYCARPPFAMERLQRGKRFGLPLRQAAQRAHQ